MNELIPTKLKDLSESKQRVMRNVMMEIEQNERKPKHQWRYVLISAILTISVVFFVLNEVSIVSEPSGLEQPNDLIRPTFSNELGHLTLDGLTLGDPQSKVIDLFGEGYSLEQEDGSGADYVMVYDEKYRFYFVEDQLIQLLLFKVDKHYFSELFNDYEGFKFMSSYSEGEPDWYIYSEETGTIIKATTQTPNDELFLYLFIPGPELWDNPDFLKVMDQM